MSLENNLSSSFDVYFVEIIETLIDRLKRPMSGVCFSSLLRWSMGTRAHRHITRTSLLTHPLTDLWSWENPVRSIPEKSLFHLGKPKSKPGSNNAEVAELIHNTDAIIVSFVTKLRN